MAGPKEKAAAMNRIKGILREANFSGHAFPFSKEYGSWETDLVRYLCGKMKYFSHLHQLENASSVFLSS